MRGLRVAALVIVSILTVALFLISGLDAAVGTCLPDGTCTGFNWGPMVTIALFGCCCAGIGLLAARRPR